MKKWCFVAILILTGIIMMLLVLIRSECQAEYICEPPEVNTEGLLHPVNVAVNEEPAQQKLYYTAEDAELIAKAVWGEARGCSTEGQAKVVWCILNRVDDSRFPDTIQGVVTQPCQFFGYSPNFPVTPEILAIVNDVLNRWNMEKNGIAVTRELSPECVFFTGDGVQNHFRAVY